MMSMNRDVAPEIEAILAERARVLSKNPDGQDEIETLPVVVFSFGDHRYAIDARFVKEIQSLANLTPVPCTPSFVAGVVNLRGTLYSLVDLRRFMDLPIKGVTDLNQILLVSGAGMELGFLAYEVLGLKKIPLDEIKAPLPNDENVAKEFVTGVTTDLTVILNLEKVLSDPKMVVHEEVMK